MREERLNTFIEVCDECDLEECDHPKRSVPMTDLVFTSKLLVGGEIGLMMTLKTDNLNEDSLHSARKNAQAAIAKLAKEKALE